MARRPRQAEPFLTLGFAAISWIEHYLVHGPGDVQGQRIELDDEFAAFLLKAYRLTVRGWRRVRRAFLSRAKGRSKSGLAAFIECFEALGPCRFDHWAEAGEVSEWGYEYDEGEPVGKPLGYVEILNVATEEGQAGNTYDAVYYMLNPETASPNLVADYGKLDVGLTRINLPDSRGFIEPVTASNESKDGGKSTFIVADETHLWIPPAKGKFRLGKMHQTMVRNLLKRKIASGWMLETSTMYADGEGSVAQGTHEYAKSLIAAGRDDGKLLFDHRQAADHWDLNKRSERISALKEAYGPAADWMDLEAIADYWDDPQASHAEFCRFFLNQPVPTADPVPKVVPGWGAAGNAELVPPELPAAVGIGVSLDRTIGSLASAGFISDDRTFLGAGRRESGTWWIVEECVRIQNEYGCAVGIAGKGPSSNLIPDLEAAGVDLTILNTDDACDAFADLQDKIATRAYVHGHDEDLDEAIEDAGKRASGERWVLDRRAGGSDHSMAEAAMIAGWVAHHGESAAVSVHGFASLELCDSCGKNPHEDPDGVHDYLCTDCREEA